MFNHYVFARGTKNCARRIKKNKLDIVQATFIFFINYYVYIYIYIQYYHTLYIKILLFNFEEMIGNTFRLRSELHSLIIEGTDQKENLG